MNKRLIVNGLGLAVLMLLALGLGVYSAHRQAEQQITARPIPGMLWPNPKTIHPFTVIDHSNQAFGREQIISKWSFMFFGYTNCPDICPVTLALMSQVYKKLANMNQLDQVQTLFVSVDPERDSSEKLAQYVSYFNPDFIGLGGSQQQIDALTSQLGVPYYRHKTDTDTEHYLVDHSGSLFISDPAGRLVAILSTPHDADEIANRFVAIKKFIEAQS